MPFEDIASAKAKEGTIVNMIKKIAITLVVAILIITTAYLIDISRMKNKKSVIFSTWGHKYTTSIKSGDKQSEPTLEENKNTTQKQETTEVKFQKDNYALSISLPIDWNYELLEASEDTGEGGIKIYASNDNKYVKICLYGERKMGVCGTDLTEQKTITNDGTSMSIGYYSNSKTWTFACTEPKYNYVVWAFNEGLEENELEKALEIIKTMKLIEEL